MKTRYLSIKSNIIILMLFTVAGCNCSDKNSQKVIVIQPFNDIGISESQLIYTSVKKIIPQVILNNTIELPSSAYVQDHKRYRADSIIRMLGRKYGKDTTVIGLTHSDISTTKGKYADWGVMGLGYRSGNACIVSTFRLRKNNLAEQLYKVALHELGHTEGLPHCSNKSCFMRDAEGGNPLDEEKDFCPKCKNYLLESGWKI